MPSRVFLDSPLPENLPVVPACRACNNGFSADEEYLACLIESVIAGSTDPDRIGRPQIAEILRRSPALRSHIEAGRRQSGEQTTFDINQVRVRNVVLKLARGHAAFELSRPCREEPSSLAWWPIPLMSPEERDSYDASHVIQTFGEVGSRGMQRLLVTQLTLNSPTGELSTLGVIVNDWVDVQDDRYRYLAVDDAGEVRIKIIIRQYLACEIVWEN